MKKTVFEEPEFQVIRFSVNDTTVVASGVDEGGNKDSGKSPYEDD